MENINEFKKAGSLGKKIIEINKPLTRLTKKREKIQITNNKNERGIILLTPLSQKG